MRASRKCSRRGGPPWPPSDGQARWPAPTEEFRLPWVGAVASILLLLTACTNAPLSRFAQGESGKPTVESRLGSKELVPEVPFDIVIDVKYPAAFTAEIPEFPAVLTDLVANDFSVADLSKPGYVHKRTTIKAVAPVEGAYTVPRFPVHFISPTGDESVEASPPLYIEIGYKPAKDAKDIRDIRPLRSRPTVWWPWVLVGTVLVLAALVAWQRERIRQWWARRRQGLNPFEAAMQRLETLRAQSPTGSAELQAYYYELSGVLRQYIEDRCGVRAVEMTTRELSQALSGGNFRDAMKLIDFLQRSEWPKYAAAVIASEPRRDWALVEQWVRQEEAVRGER